MHRLGKVSVWAVRSDLILTRQIASPFEMTSVKLLCSFAIATPANLTLTFVSGLKSRVSTLAMSICILPLFVGSIRQTRSLCENIFPPVVTYLPS